MGRPRELSCLCLAYVAYTVKLLWCIICNVTKFHYSRLNLYTVYLTHFSCLFTKNCVIIVTNQTWSQVRKLIHSEWIMRKCFVLSSVCKHYANWLFFFLVVMSDFIYSLKKKSQGLSKSNVQMSVHDISSNWWLMLNLSSRHFMKHTLMILSTLCCMKPLLK